MLDAQDIDPDQMIYLTEFKQKLNEHMAKEVEKRQRELDKAKKKGGVVIDTDDQDFIRQTFSHISSRKNIKR